MKTATVSIAAGMIFSTVCFSSRANADWAEAKAAQRAGLDLVQAVTMLEEQYEASVMEIEVDDRRGIFVYEVELFDVSQQREIEVALDLNTGEMLSEKIKSDNPRKASSSDKAFLADTVQHSGFGIAQAVLQVRAQNLGTVYEAEIKLNMGEPTVEVKILSAEGKQKIFMDIGAESSTLEKAFTSISAAPSASN
jgi:hypothetical protein